MANFWKRVVDENPELIGSMVYFSPTKNFDLSCIIRDDGTISPFQMQILRISSIGDLVNSWIRGVITDDDGRKLPARFKKSKFCFSDDFFFNKGRHRLVKEIYKMARPRSPIAQTKPCPGFDRRRHAEVIADRKWDTTRIEFSPINFEGDKCRSRKCLGEMNETLSLCHACKSARQQLWNARQLLKKRKTNERSRILNTPNRWLTNAEKFKKMQYRLEEAQRKLRTKSRETSSLRAELKRYRPAEEENRPAVRSFVKKMDKEQLKVRSPICRWVLDGDEICGYEAPSIISLVRHVREEHFHLQFEANKERSFMDGRQYFCGWELCKRRAPFTKFKHLRHHLANHTGNAKTQRGLEILREQMINWARPPSGRRYGASIEQAILHRWRSRSTHQHAQNLSTMPLPSVRTVLKWKNHGGLKSGVDWTVLKEMEAIGKAAPELCHGILSFDEVSMFFCLRTWVFTVLPD